MRKNIENSKNDPKKLILLIESKKYIAAMEKWRKIFFFKGIRDK